MSFTLILIISLYIPFVFSFDVDTSQGSLLVFDIFLDSWFILEIFMNSLTAYYEKGLLI